MESSVLNKRHAQRSLCPKPTRIGAKPYSPAGQSPGFTIFALLDALTPIYTTVALISDTGFFYLGRTGQGPQAAASYRAVRVASSLGPRPWNPLQWVVSTTLGAHERGRTTRGSGDVVRSRIRMPCSIYVLLRVIPPRLTEAVRRIRINGGQRQWVLIPDPGLGTATA